MTSQLIVTREQASDIEAEAQAAISLIACDISRARGIRPASATDDDDRVLQVRALTALFENIERLTAKKVLEDITTTTKTRGNA